MGSFLSKESTGNQSINDEVTETPELRIEKANFKAGSKRPVAEEADQDVKPKKSKRKDGWAKKAAEGKPKGGELTPRPENLGPREERVRKTKVALLIGFNGTGYQGMQL